jgi:hypothetical protein
VTAATPRPARQEARTRRRPTEDAYSIITE